MRIIIFFWKKNFDQYLPHNDSTIYMQTTTTIISICIYLTRSILQKNDDDSATYLLSYVVWSVFFFLYRMALRIKPVMISSNTTDINVAIVIKQHFFYGKRNMSFHHKAKAGGFGENGYICVYFFLSFRITSIGM